MSIMNHPNNAMQPQRSQEGTLLHVVETLLDKGLVLNVDIMVSVAGVELLGIRIRAALASFETAARYGLDFPAGTDRDTVAWKQAVEQKDTCPECGKRAELAQLMNEYCPWCGWRSAMRSGSNQTMPRGSADPPIPQTPQPTGAEMTVADDSMMQPTRDPRATLPDLIEALLNQEVHLNLDLIISVADIPLIGVSLRATIAGIETMLEYGMMRQWDSDTREWVHRAVRTHLPIADDEEILAKMAGGHYQDDFYRTWRPGSAYLTSQRLIIHRRDPAETLWQAPLNSIASVPALRESSIGGEESTRILVRLSDGSEAIPSALEPDHLIALVQAELDRADERAPSRSEAKTTADRPLREGSMWFLEELSSGSTWRGGQASLSCTELTWRSPMDGRARVRISPEQPWDIRREERSNPTDERRVLILDTADSTIALAADAAGAWSAGLEDRRTVPGGMRSAPLETPMSSGRKRDDCVGEEAASWH